MAPVTERIKSGVRTVLSNSQYTALVIYTVALFLLGGFSLPVKIILALGAASLIYAIPVTAILVFTLLYTALLLITGRFSQTEQITELYFAVCVYVVVEMAHIAVRYFVKRTQKLLEP
ncbi:MAG: hypothetical protein TR69_WS6001000820 [candidate division WS6 bacterium OLB20]|uniref:Uncharacterized protein n=1 Tax=candidate division WS6 bacterium OLB20 TaxID=1617426 RepID=A0A136LYR7_9BACT|nr:MAG: hypothetical protein TR69_WS6001000820 [candidate division WS6 bacterium OLB20]